MSLIAFTLDGEGFRPYAPNKWPTTKIFGYPNADFSPKNVKFASSSLCSTFSQSFIWSTTNFLHPSLCVNSSFSEHPFIGISSKKGIVMLGMQSFKTLFNVDCRAFRFGFSSFNHVYMLRSSTTVADSPNLSSASRTHNHEEAVGLLDVLNHALWYHVK